METSRREQYSTPLFEASVLAAMHEVDGPFAKLLQEALAPSFTLVKPLGIGGMGAVFLARDPALRRMVAVKVMSPALSRDAEARARFQREAKAVAAISHPNVVSIYSVGELENGTPYIVMQYVDGLAMDARIASEGPLDVATAKRVLGEVAAALAAAHAKGIVHRDIKPSNVLWDATNGRALVTDFGIAAILADADDVVPSTLTQPGRALGTPAYMSPEQVREQPITEKTDIYSLGLLGYELLAGQGPYVGDSPRELMAAHLKDVPRRLTILREDCEPELAQLLEACLAKDPKLRPTAAEVSRRLVHGTSALLEWPPPGLERLRTRFAATMPMLVGGGLMLGVPLAVQSVLGRSELLRVVLSPLPVVLILTCFGLLAFAAGALQLLSAFADARRFVAAGFGWLTVVETAVDARGDTGALIAGAREYALLSPQQRNALRAGRLASGALVFLGAVAPIVGYFIGLSAAVRLGGGPAFLVGSSIVLGLLLLLGARILVWREGWMLRDARRLRISTAPRAEPVRLAEAWTTSFRAASGGQRIGTGGTRGHRVLAPLGAGLVILSVLIGAVVAYSMITLPAVGQRYLGDLSWDHSWYSERVRRAHALQLYRLPTDSSITPLQAGRWFYEMRAANTAAPNAITRPELIDGLRDGRCGIPADLRSRLQKIDPQTLQGFRDLARAGSYDYHGARFSLGELDTMLVQTIGNMAYPSFFRMEALSRANIATAVLALADGRPAEAELRLREVVSVGLLFIRHGNWPWDHVVGAEMVELAQLALAASYEGVGRPAEARSVASAGTEPFFRWTDRMQPDFWQAIARARRDVVDTNLPRGVRLDMLYFQVAYAPCFDLRQIVFGPDPAHVAAVATARKSLVRFPSDSILFVKVERALDRPLPDARDGAQVAIVPPIAAALDWLTGSRRVRSCASLIKYLM